MQGGCFDIYNRLYLNNGFFSGFDWDDGPVYRPSYANSKGGISVFEVPYSWPSKNRCQELVRVAASNQKSGFQYQFNDNYQEPEGITWWDLDIIAERGYGMQGQLHAIMLGNNSKIVDSKNYDYIYFKHYHCNVVPLLGHIVTENCAVCGTPITLHCADEAAKVPQNKMHYCWNIATSIDAYNVGDWKTVHIGNTYTPTASDAGKYLQVTATADGYVGTIYSASEKIKARVNGTVRFTTETRCGISVKAECTDELGRIPSKDIYYGWQISHDGETEWTDIDNATTNSYTPSSADVNKYLRVKVFIDNYCGTYYYSESRIVLPEISPKHSKKLGDITGDGVINAVDASKILSMYTNVSTGRKMLTEEELKLCDVNGDGEVNAVDASKILAYYSYTSTGGDKSLEEFLKQ